METALLGPHVHSRHMACLPKQTTPREWSGRGGPTRKPKLRIGRACRGRAGTCVLLRVGREEGKG
jgi:hypothetical protein